MNDPKEYIERNALLNLAREVTEFDEGGWGIDYKAVPVDDIKEIPASDVAPVVHGEWKPYRTPIETRQSGWICTNCSGVQYDLSNGDTDYCPHCGARMDGGSNESS